MGEITATSVRTPAPVITSKPDDTTPKAPVRKPRLESAPRDGVDLLDRPPIRRRPGGDIKVLPDIVRPPHPEGPGSRRPPIGIMPELPRWPEWSGDPGFRRPPINEVPGDPGFERPPINEVPGDPGFERPPIGIMPELPRWPEWSGDPGFRQPPINRFPGDPGFERPPIGIMPELPELPERPRVPKPPKDFPGVPDDLRDAYESYQRWLDSKTGPGPHTMEYRQPPPGWGQYQKNERLEDIENSDYPDEVKDYLRRVEGLTSPDGTTKMLYIPPPAGWEEHFGPKVVPL